MKLGPRDVDSQLRALDRRYAAVLVYGPNEGLVRERAETIARQVVPDLKDPFNVSNLTSSEIAADPARLGDEAAAMSMLGGRRVVRIDAAGEAVAGPLGFVLGDYKGDSLIVLAAGDLTPRSALRKLIEDAQNAVAIACYDDDARSIGDLIRASLEAQGLRIEQDAGRYLVDHLGSDRMVARGELEKLGLYKAADSDRMIRLADVEAIIGDSSSTAIDEVASATTGGDLPALDRALEKAFIQGETAVGLLRAVARRLLRLYEASGYLAEGARPDEAVKRLRPPLFFKDVSPFTTQLNRWSAERLVSAIRIVQDAETDAKSSLLPAETICARACLRIANAARAARG
ncbi:DNA polymerase III subunit delta [Govanella unica]|uniref:DNA-directed DNA polymerase n=1 Tax=Govanella unica TaxID=2975056 RepID=A0A9X3Z5W2_9PROT|nr:DNA polymerase III subunit delta [Govania unica]MDA5192452.1 DNA polymerase III subunit delta [Govania unica]